MASSYKVKAKAETLDSRQFCRRRYTPYMG